ncbi:MAG: hypothetical protein RLZZ628_1686 [Bacteroidota bacterium]|jgi:hypothetical protein
MKVFYLILFLIFCRLVSVQAQDVRNGTPESVSAKNPKLFVNHGAIPNSQFYDNVTIEDLKNQEFKLGKDIAFGGSVGTNLHLQNGSILFCRTNNGIFSNWAKLQIISFGKEDNTLPEL